MDEIWHLSIGMEKTEKTIFEQRYRVVAVLPDRLQVRGILNGELLTILNPEPDCPLKEGDFPPGKLISLTDPSIAPAN
jgi:hypothetical protein